MAKLPNIGPGMHFGSHCKNQQYAILELSEIVLLAWLACFFVSIFCVCGTYDFDFDFLAGKSPVQPLPKTVLSPATAHLLCCSHHCLVVELLSAICFCHCLVVIHWGHH
jgi:hypothetical protein